MFDQKSDVWQFSGSLVAVVCPLGLGETMVSGNREKEREAKTGVAYQKGMRDNGQRDVG